MYDEPPHHAVCPFKLGLTSRFVMKAMVSNLHAEIFLFLS